ncbi:MAG: murein L,D-transpeptidase family protein [Pseudomonadota bacterium]|nr:murein L,D-transpeptidase family protein [Pseudomonadota bacterium]
MYRGKVSSAAWLTAAVAVLSAVLWPILGRSVLAATGDSPTHGRAEAAHLRVLPALERRLNPLGLKLGNPVFVRIFKQERELELWMQSDADRAYQLVHSYPICAYSGELGPKTRQGDGQAPEGFYSVRRAQLNPASSYHLSFNLGYPNVFEHAQGWTGDYLMVHGNCVSIGCYAMGDEAIEEIYTLMDAALRSGQRAVNVHAFPFHLDAKHEAQRQNSPHAEFWAQLAEGYRAFDTARLPPQIRVLRGHYRVE